MRTNRIAAALMMLSLAACAEEAPDFEVEPVATLCSAERCEVAEETTASRFGEPEMPLEAPDVATPDEPVVSYPTAGKHLLTLSMVHAPTKPLVFVAYVETDGDQVTMSLQALDAFDRESPVGDLIDVAPVDALTSSEDLLVFPHWPVGDDMLPTFVPADANPLDNEKLEMVNLNLRPMALAPYLCGSVEGELVSPTGADLKGSTFTLLPIEEALNDETPVLDCAGNAADPLSAL